MQTVLKFKSEVDQVLEDGKPRHKNIASRVNVFLLFFYM